MAIDELAFPIEHFFRAKNAKEIQSKITLGYFNDRKFGEAFVAAVSPEPKKKTKKAGE